MRHQCPVRLRGLLQQPGCHRVRSICGMLSIPAHPFDNVHIALCRWRAPCSKQFHCLLTRFRGEGGWLPGFFLLSAKLTISPRTESTPECNLSFLCLHFVGVIPSRCFSSAPERPWAAFLILLVEAYEAPGRDISTANASGWQCPGRARKPASDNSASQRRRGSRSARHAPENQRHP
jgi:hypothetical protein